MKFSEECGIFGGVAFDSNVAPHIQQGLFMLQHRGQENAGICCGDHDLFIHKNRGLVLEVLNEKIIKTIRGKTGIGHVRYSTQGGSDALNAQPFMVKYLSEKVAIAHNGNVKAAMTMKNKLEKEGEVFLTTSDTEMILKKVIRTLCKLPSTWTYEEVGKVLEENFTGGAWSILFGFPGRVMAFRDPLGYRPLFFCKSKEGLFVSSEDSAFQLLTNKNIIELQPGQGVEIIQKTNSYKIFTFAQEKEHKKCVFEHIYFSRPDSNVFGRSVYLTRVELGKLCAIENPVEVDMIVPVMESGFAASIGYAQQSGIPMHMGLMRNRWVGRTFIQPEQEQRRNSVIKKLIPIKELIQDKRIVLIDDSIVRGTTSKEIVRMLRNAGAREIHFRVASPPIVNTCCWGVDIPTKKELLANCYENFQAIGKFIGAESIGYLSLEGLKNHFGQKGWCYHCLMKG